MDERLYTVGELARKFGVTVRTLQFYDNNGLVSPGYHSEGGRRLYGRKDILRLQQILFLKSFGFSLEEIRDKLLPISQAKELIPVLQNQKEVIQNRITYLQDAIRQIDSVSEEVRQGSDISLEKLISIVNVMKMGNQYAHVLRYFDTDRLEEIMEPEENSIELDREMQNMIEEMFRLHAADVRPESELGMDLAARWLSLVQIISKGDPKFLEQAYAAGGDIQNWPDSMGAYKTVMQEFLSHAIAAYTQKQSEKEQNHE